MIKFYSYGFSLVTIILSLKILITGLERRKLSQFIKKFMLLLINRYHLVEWYFMSKCSTLIQVGYSIKNKKKFIIVIQSI